MTYALDTSHTSPNHGSAIVPRPAAAAVIHWWGTPSGQTLDGTVAWLCNPAAQVSAHEVITTGRVAQILDHRLRSWANGNDWANNNTLTFECDPNHVPGAIDTLVERLADLVRAGDLTTDFQLTGHRDWYNTACPGDYYPQLAAIRQRVTDNLAGKATSQEEDMNTAQDSALSRILQIAEALDTAVNNTDRGPVAQAAARINGHTNESPRRDGGVSQWLGQGDADIVMDVIISAITAALTKAVNQLKADQDIDIEGIKTAAADGARAGIDARIASAQVTLTAVQGATK